MARRILRTLVLCTFVLPAVLPFSCARPLLEILTPFVIDGSSGFMTDPIFSASPLVL